MVEASHAGPSWTARARAVLRSPRATLLAALAFAFVAFWIGYGITVFVLFPAVGTPKDLVPVPKLVGRDREDARRVLEERRLEYVEADSLQHPSAPAGAVIAQDPLPRQLARRGGAVEVTVSRGPEQRPVPDVVGLHERQAAVVLGQAGFRPVARRVDAEMDVGRVVGTQPGPGHRLELPAEVTVLVSAGPRIVVVPDLLTRSLPEARATLERLGLRLGRVVPDSSADAAPGTVLAQNPLAGTTVSRGDSVSVAVATGPEGAATHTPPAGNNGGR